MTEQDLVNRCREGDRAAQKELYDQTSDRIYRVLLGITGNPDDAFDIAQETYVKAFAAIGRFDSRSSVATWLYRIAVNEALQFRRREARMRQKIGTMPTKRPDVSADERTAVRLDVSAAMAHIHDIAPDDCAILLLRYQEELDYKTIAQVLDTAEGTVASRLNRARDKLRKILQKSYDRREDTDANGHPINVTAAQEECDSDRNCDPPQSGAARRIDKR